jgi:hypothetical protein
MRALIAADFTEPLADCRRHFAADIMSRHVFITLFAYFLGFHFSPAAIIAAAMMLIFAISPLLLSPMPPFFISLFADSAY